MAGAAPAQETPTPAPEGADVSLLDDAGAGAPGAENSASPETKAADAAKTESKPAPKAGDDGKGEAKAYADLLADDDEGTPEKKADGQADADKGKAPETYEAFTVPEGVVIDEETLAKATPIFKDAGLNQEQAQKLVSFYADMQAAAGQAQVAQFQEIKQGWAAEIKADPEFGGAKFDRTLGAAKAVLTKFGDTQLRNDLKEWGWANHPGFIRLLARVNASLSEDTLVTADTSAQPSAPKRKEEILWPGMNSKE